MLQFFVRVAALALLCALAGPASATPYFVATNGNDTTGDGLTWATAWLTISNAVAQTTDGDTVTVSNGTYNTVAEISITNAITVQSVNGASNTVVNRSTPGAGAPKHRIFYIAHSSAVVDGFTITNGYSPGTGWLTTGNGGGVFLSSGTVKNCVITMCNASYGGGVSLQSGGMVSNCVITKSYGITWCGGVFINTSGTVVDSRITGNTALYLGAGVFCSGGGLVRNCLITEGSCRGPGGVYLSGGGTVESCTISRNIASGGGGGAPGGGIGGSAGTVKNTIVYFNTASDVTWGDNWGSGPSYSYTCTTPAVGGTSNITDEPLFVNYTNGNYRLSPGSSCFDAGQSNAWMAGATDLDGNARIIGATVDIGAYEFEEGDLMCSFEADSLEGFDPLTVTLTGYVSGSDTNGMGYQWDVDNNGSIDYSGPITYQGPAVPASIVTNAYTSGVFTVSLTVTNAAGETNTYTRENYITVGPATNYVDWASASPAFPYASWATAATNIQDAVNAGVDGTIVLVTNGTYAVTNQVSITKGVTVRSVNGADLTTIQTVANVLSVYLNHADAAVDGFTLTKDPAQAYGGRVYISYAGTVRNCIIKNTRYNLSWGCAVSLVSGGTVSNCVITGNTNTYGSVAPYPGGVYVYITGTLRNCLIADNFSNCGGAAGVLNQGGTVESCTITGNRATLNDATAVGGLYMLSGGTVRNCIVYFNTNTTTGVGTNVYQTGGTISYTCTTPAVGGTGNITDNPQFVNADAGDYLLHEGSPCIDVGLNQAWMTGATDLRGSRRIRKITVDLGCYEYMPPAGTIFIIGK